jgi:hypothetical protein
LGSKPRGQLRIDSPRHAQRDAYSKLQELAGAYGRIREARAALQRLGLAPEFDSDGRFSEFRNAPDVLPIVYRALIKALRGPNLWSAGSSAS